MMIEKATVVAYQNGIATVQCYAKSGCGSCASNSACGTKALSALAGEKSAPQFALKVSERLEVGDQIELGLTERSLLSGVFWLYGIPLLVVLISSLLFSHWIDNELWVALLMLISTVTAFFTIKKILSRKGESGFVPVFLRKI